jgi:hyperosmotically inducible protein
MKAKAILLLLGFLSVGAFAQNAQQEKTPLFVKLDKNKDGYVSRAEARADKGVAKFFDKADANHDGRLDEDETIKARNMADSEKAGQYIDDSAITTKVKSALLAKKGISSVEITVETFHGVVQLSGFVDTAAQVKLAGRTAAGVKGVREVKNSLNVKPKE